jgi:hypothetical protein
VKTRPILMSAPMVRALLVGNKTQTRRVVKNPPIKDFSGHWNRYNGKGITGVYHSKESACEAIAKHFCPYGVPGNRLWVRESFQPLLSEDVKWSDADYETGEGYAISYPATDGVKEFYDYSKDESISDRITPSIFMPRWASRIMLEITDVRVQRLQDISEDDAAAEGSAMGYDGHYSFHQRFNHRGGYMALWNAINGAGAWDKNPWVWAVTFKVVQP